MRIKVTTLLCALIVTVLAVEKKSTEPRGKRNLEYSIFHNYPQTQQTFRSERRISTAPQVQKYSPFFPGPRPYTSYRKGRPQTILPPPYAVQMEPLVHYSQRDPLFNTNTLSLIVDGHNDLSKPDDLLTENNHVSENVYGPSKHYVERPIYIKEPEPIIEIIIKESNVSLPPLPTPPPAPKKKEQVQVFYVKYKKNPHGHGKDSIIYEKPIPAISPVIPDEHEEEPPETNYGVPEVVTPIPKPPSTTLRTVIKPDSETYHSPSGIKVTFGKEGWEHDKRSSKPDAKNEESQPEPTVRFPHARQFPSQPINYNRRQPIISSTFQNYRPDRFPYQFRPLSEPYRRTPHFKTGPPQSNSHFTFPSLSKYPPPDQPPNFKLTPQFQASLHSRHPPTQYSQSSPLLQHPEFNFNAPRQPVPYKPFEHLLPQQPQFTIPTSPSHFPLQQQPPNIFNQHQTDHHQDRHPQQNIPPNHRPPTQNIEDLYNQQAFQKQQQSRPHLHNSGIHIPPNVPEQPTNHPPSKQEQPVNRQPQDYQPLNQQPNVQVNEHPNRNAPQQQQNYQFSEHNRQPQTNEQEHNNPQPVYQSHNHHQPQVSHEQQNHLQNLQAEHRIIPPGGELIQSLPKYEQHISVEVNQPQHPNPTQVYQEKPRHREEYKQQTPSTEQPPPQQYFVQSAPSLQTQHNPNEQYYNSQQTHSTSPRPDTQNNYYNQQNPAAQYYSSFQQSHSTTSRPTTQKPAYKSPPTTTTTERSTTTESREESVQNNPELVAQLPDEVPEELRQQLLSSGILSNAQISVLDYDKVGDIPLSALPPDQLANFYNAGGAQQLAAAGSEIAAAYTQPEPEPINPKKDQETAASEIQEVREKPPVEMKVVRYNPDTEEERRVQDYYIKEDAKQLDPVSLDDQSYNRYLPLKVSGAGFPIPDVPELRGKNITSVVVLAPVTDTPKGSQRVERDTTADSKLIPEKLKKLLKEPSAENYQKFLDSENRTSSDKQAIILLVAGSGENREIFMYDVGTHSVNKLNGELSTAFVDAAELNASDDASDSSAAASNRVETVLPYPGAVTHDTNKIATEDDLSSSASNYVDSRVPIIDPFNSDDLQLEETQQLESFVDVSGLPVSLNNQDLTAASSNSNSVENKSSGQ